jgi:hypothetical protein
MTLALAISDPCTSFAAHAHTCADDSPVVYLRTPIRTRDARTFRGIGEAATMRAL